MAPDPSDADFENAARTLDDILTFCDAHHIKGFHHAHLGTMIETVEDAERLLAAAPSLWLLFDTGHMLAAGSDPMQVLRATIYGIGSGMSTSRTAMPMILRLGITERNVLANKLASRKLGAGNLGLDVKAALEGLEAVGYDGWVSVELDRPVSATSPAEAAVVNREYLRGLGY